jgi:hypothetical protein
MAAWLLLQACESREAVTAPPSILGPALELKRLALSDDRVVVQVLLTQGLPNDPRLGKVERPSVALTVDQCPAPAPAVEGQLTFGGPASNLVLSSAALPKGDLELTFTAFNEQLSLLLAHDDAGLRSITMQEMRGYKGTPGNPAQGEPGTFVLDYPPCK